MALAPASAAPLPISKQPKTKREQRRKASKKAPSDDRVDVDSERQGLLRKYDKVARSRDDMLLVRSQAKNEWQKCHYCRMHLMESQKAFMVALGEGIEGQHSLSSTKALRGLYEQVVADDAALLEQGTITKDLESKLSSLEYLLAKRETSFMNSIELYQSALRGTAQDLAENWKESASLDADGDDDSSRGAAPSDTPSILRRYFDKAGDVKLLEEKLHDLIIDYHDAITQREFQQDQGLLFPDSDEDFHRLFEREQVMLRNELNDEDVAAVRLRLQCVELGLKPDAYGKQSCTSSQAEDDQPVTPDYQSPETQVNKEYLPPGFSLAKRNESSLQLAKTRPLYDDSGPFEATEKGGNPADSTKRVENWLETMPSSEVLDYTVDRIPTKPGTPVESPPLSDSQWAKTGWDIWTGDRAATASPIAPEPHPIEQPVALAERPITPQNR